MSDTCLCDNCGSKGTRRTGAVCPEGWFYVEVKLYDLALGSPGVFYMVACSEKCCKVEWKPGPGNLRDPDPEQFPGRDKTIRSRLQRIQLEDEE